MLKLDKVTFETTSTFSVLESEPIPPTTATVVGIRSSSRTTQITLLVRIKNHKEEANIKAYLFLVLERHPHPLLLPHHDHNDSG